MESCTFVNKTVTQNGIYCRLYSNFKHIRLLDGCKRHSLDHSKLFTSFTMLYYTPLLIISVVFFVVVDVVVMDIISHRLSNCVQFVMCIATSTKQLYISVDVQEKKCVPFDFRLYTQFLHSPKTQSNSNTRQKKITHTYQSAYASTFTCTNTYIHLVIWSHGHTYPKRGKKNQMTTK